MWRTQLWLGVFLRRGKPAGGTMMESTRTVIVQPVLGTGVGVGHFSTLEHPSQAEKSLVFPCQHCDLSSIFVFGLLPQHLMAIFLSIKVPFLVVPPTRLNGGEPHSLSSSCSLESHSKGQKSLANKSLFSTLRKWCHLGGPHILRQLFSR